MFFLFTFVCMYVHICMYVFVSIAHTSKYIHKQIYEIVQASTNPYFLSSHSERRRTISPTTTPPTKHSEKYPSVHMYVFMYVLYTDIYLYTYVYVHDVMASFFYVRPCKCRHRRVRLWVTFSSDVRGFHFLPRPAPCRLTDRYDDTWLCLSVCLLVCDVSVIFIRVILFDLLKYVIKGGRRRVGFASLKYSNMNYLFKDKRRFIFNYGLTNDVSNVCYCVRSSIGKNFHIVHLQFIGISRFR